MGDIIFFCKSYLFFAVIVKERGGEMVRAITVMERGRDQGIKCLRRRCLFSAFFHGAEGGARTRTSGEGERILSPSRLPVPPPRLLTHNLKINRGNS